MKRWRRAGIYVLLVLVLIVGFSLPTIAGRIQDSQTDQTEEDVIATTVQLDMGSTLTVLQKLRISAERASSVELDSAQTMNDEDAWNKLLSGLDILFAAEDEIPFNVNDFSEVNHTINLKISGEDSLIYWEYWLADTDANQISVILDDDTGIILSLNYTLNLTPPEIKTREQTIGIEAPLFSVEDITADTANIFSTDGFFGGLEETGSSPEELLTVLQRQYCDDYLKGQGYHFSWSVDTSEPVDNSYQYSVMMVDNAGGYYVLPFTITNNEISIN